MEILLHFCFQREQTRANSACSHWASGLGSRLTASLSTHSGCLYLASTSRPARYASLFRIGLVFTSTDPPLLLLGLASHCPCTIELGIESTVRQTTIHNTDPSVRHRCHVQCVIQPRHHRPDLLHARCAQYSCGSDELRVKTSRIQNSWWPAALHRPPCKIPLSPPPSSPSCNDQENNLNTDHLHPHDPRAEDRLNPCNTVDCRNFVTAHKTSI